MKTAGFVRTYTLHPIAIPPPSHPVHESMTDAWALTKPQPCWSASLNGDNHPSYHMGRRRGESVTITGYAANGPLIPLWRLARLSRRGFADCPGWRGWV
jgi:hypothetical protein